ncbi:MAG TPA: cytochrome c oxidase subunit IVB [Bacillota bacterium]|nr:cytochrome c oxidase subunit IVB [Bacillota bacterium]
MTDNVESSHVDAFEKERSKDEMKRQVISFALMIVFTLASFGLVASGKFSSMFVIPVILIMALVQVAFQFYYFMHMKDKDHEMPSTLIYGGVWCAALTFTGLAVITWW